jgi:hypothetical protein
MTSEEQTLRDKVRSQVFSSDVFKRESVEAFGTTIDIRQTTLGRVLELQEKLSEDRKVAIGLAFLEFCYVPGTDTRLFDDADLDMVLGLPFGEDFQKVQDVINKLMGVSDKDIKEAEGNLGETSDDTTSSSSPSA